MGSPKFPQKKYNTPLHPWKEERIKSERELIKKYGLKNHKEVWKAKTFLGKYRHQARELLAKIDTKDPQITKESNQLLLHLTRMGILPSASSLDDVLALETEVILSRRLQTLVYLKGLSSTVDQSRQLINHGHIAIGDRKVTIPGYMVEKDEEPDIGYTKKSVLNEVSHPARPKTDVIRAGAAVFEPEKTTSDKPEEPPTEKQSSEPQKTGNEKPKETPPKKIDTDKTPVDQQTKQEKPAQKQPEAPATSSSEEKPSESPKNQDEKPPKENTKKEPKKEEKETRKGEE
jgi:small subunit ribosomal protein S4